MLTEPHKAIITLPSDTVIHDAALEYKTCYSQKKTRSEKQFYHNRKTTLICRQTLCKNDAMILCRKTHLVCRKTVVLCRVDLCRQTVVGRLHQDSERLTIELTVIC